MAIILKHGKPTLYKGVCPSCMCEFAYSDAETKQVIVHQRRFASHKHVRCPECNTLVDVENMRVQVPTGILGQIDNCTTNNIK